MKRADVAAGGIYALDNEGSPYNDLPCLLLSADVYEEHKDGDFYRYTAAPHHEPHPGPAPELGREFDIPRTRRRYGYLLLTGKEEAISRAVDSAKVLADLGRCGYNGSVRRHDFVPGQGGRFGAVVPDGTWPFFLTSLDRIRGHYAEASRTS